MVSFAMRFAIPKSISFSEPDTSRKFAGLGFR